MITVWTRLRSSTVRSMIIARVAPSLVERLADKAGRGFNSRLYFPVRDSIDSKLQNLVHIVL